MEVEKLTIGRFYLSIYTTLTSSETSSVDRSPSIWVRTGVAAAINSLQIRSTLSIWSWVTTVFELNSI